MGLSKSIADQPGEARSLVSTARWVVVLSWAFYPVVYFACAVGTEGATASTIIQVGYTIADTIAKSVFGVLIYMIAVRKSGDLADDSANAGRASA